MENVGLVLEGGGMKGLYTAGVLEFFMEKDLYFPYVIGVSAGACMAASYLSRQKGRNKKVNIDLVSDHRYISLRNLLKNRELFGMDFLFDEIPNKIVPFDFEAYLKSTEQFVVVTTDCHTGEPVYFDKQGHGKDLLTIIRASSSLPFLAPSVEYANKTLLDGGIIDPIPIKKSQADGNKKNIIVMTKPVIERKQPNWLSRQIKYRKHPKINERLLTRYQTYNETLSHITTEIQNGDALIIQPSRKLPVSRTERNQGKLIQLYELGYQDAKKQYEEILRFVKNR